MNCCLFTTNLKGEKKVQKYVKIINLLEFCYWLYICLRLMVFGLLDDLVLLQKLSQMTKDISRDALFVVYFFFFLI